MAVYAGTRGQQIIVLSRSQVVPGLRQMVAAYLQRGTPFAFDTETTGLEPRKHKLILLQFAQEGQAPVVVDVRHGVDLSQVGQVLDPLFEELECLGINLKFDYKMLKFHTGTEIRQLWDVKLAEQTILGLGTSDASKRNIHFGLKDIAPKYGQIVSKEERNWFIDLDQRPEEWNAPIPQQQIEYAAQDVTVLFPIWKAQAAQVEDNRLNDAKDLEMCVSPAIGDMELNGMPIDIGGWREVVADAAIEREAVEDQLHDIFDLPILEARAVKYDYQLARYEEWMAAKVEHEKVVRKLWETGAKKQADETNQPYTTAFLKAFQEKNPWGEFKKKEMAAWREQHPKPDKPKQDTSIPNLGSYSQMITAFERMGIGWTRSDGSFVPLDTTKDEALKELEDQFHQLSLLRQWGKLNKFVTSFGETLLKFVDPETSRISAEFDQYGASTSRMSCKRPNLQQIPSKSNWGARVRACVKARPGHKILTADYSSIEPRILAELSGDPILLRLFDEGKDIYSETARMVMGLPDHINVKKEHPHLRTLFKTIMLGLSYGMGPYTLAKRVEGLTKEEAEEHIANFFKLYKGVARHLEQAKHRVVVTGQTRTISGGWRKFDIPEKPVKRSDSPEDLAQWKRDMWDYRKQIERIQRQAMNAPIQGSSAAITKLAVIFFKRYNKISTACLIAVVHDELVVECPEEYVPQVAKALGDAMDNAVKYFLKRVKVPYPDVVISDHWTKE